jgi:peptidoglycan/xylan/chitin deacetylase (PgdA/CDA1 family)
VSAQAAAEAYAADSSLRGKLRRRYVRLLERKPAHFQLDRPLLSISFDDAPATAAHEGARRVEAAGVLATYFISAGLCGETGPMGLNATADEVKAVAASGHEIACHTFSHLDCGQAGAPQIAEDVGRNSDRLAALGLGRPTTFAYPYGDVSIDAKRVLGPRYRALRGLHEGVVEDGSDLNQMPAVGIEGPDGEARASRWLTEAARRRGWLLLYTHDVSDSPSAWGCTPEALDRLLAQAKALDFEIRTVDGALNRIGAAA